MTAEVAMAALRETHRPHRLAKDVAGDLWEFISFPWIEDDKVVILIRVPGDPTTMFPADALQMDPDGRECLCAEAGHDYYMTAEYYAERQRRLGACPARLTLNN